MFKTYINKTIKFHLLRLKKESILKSRKDSPNITQHTHINSHTNTQTQYTHTYSSTHTPHTHPTHTTTTFHYCQGAINLYT